MLRILQENAVLPMAWGRLLSMAGMKRSGSRQRCRSAIQRPCSCERGAQPRNCTTRNGFLLVDDEDRSVRILVEASIRIYCMPNASNRPPKVVACQFTVVPTIVIDSTFRIQFDGCRYSYFKPSFGILLRTVTLHSFTQSVKLAKFGDVPDMHQLEDLRLRLSRCECLFDMTLCPTNGRPCMCNEALKM